MLSFSSEGLFPLLGGFLCTFPKSQWEVCNERAWSVTSKAVTANHGQRNGFWEELQTVCVKWLIFWRKRDRLTTPEIFLSLHVQGVTDWILFVNMLIVELDASLQDTYPQATTAHGSQYVSIYLIKKNLNGNHWAYILGDFDIVSVPLAAIVSSRLNQTICVYSAHIRAMWPDVRLL